MIAQALGWDNHGKFSKVSATSKSGVAPYSPIVRIDWPRVGAGTTPEVADGPHSRRSSLV